MTETASKQSQDTQKEWFFINEKQNCKKVALDYASRHLSAGGSKLLLSDAIEIYDWLIKDLK